MNKKELIIRRRHLMMGSTAQERDWSLEPLTFIARENCNILGYSYDNSYNVNTENVLISINGGPLQGVTMATGYWSINNNYITLNAGDEMAVYVDGNFHVDFYDIDGSSAFGTYDIAGNIMSLRYGQDFLNHTEFGTRSLAFSKDYGTFFKSTQIVDASNLIIPGTIVYPSMFQNMFKNCKLLEKAPKILPATSLSASCYANMFNACSSLTTAPELPATSLSASCYESMFNGCTNLTTAPELPATRLIRNCYANMFNACSSLTTAPELPATTLVTNCYQRMFFSCKNLNRIKALFTTTPSDTYTRSWVYDVAQNGTFVKNANATWTNVGINAVPSGWTIETE